MSDSVMCRVAISLYVLQEIIKKEFYKKKKKYPLDIRHISSHIQEYFTLNDVPEMPALTQWEAHKCIIHGKFLAIADKLK